MQAIESDIFLKKFKVSSISITYLPDTFLTNEIAESENLDLFDNVYTLKRYPIDLSLDFEANEEGDIALFVYLKTNCDDEGMPLDKSAVQLSLIANGVVSSKETKDSSDTQFIINAFAIFLGQIRGYLASVTSQFECGTYYLPAIDVEQTVMKIMEERNNEGSQQLYDIKLPEN
ncbi:MAG: hypothetical protein JST55_10710 [Bacteroidetes bacterium]|nr:hypothetical protein [Bacteroidota bacterium]